MLPDIPEQKARLMALVQIYLRTAPYRAKPFLERLSTFVQHEGRDASYQRVDGKVVNFDYKEISGTLAISRSEIPNLSIDVLLAKIDEIGEKMANEKFQIFLATIDKAATESGNSQDLKGQPFSQEHYLEMLEGISMTFKEDGSWEHPTLLANPNQAKKILSKLEEWSKDAQFQKKLEKLMERKRKQFNDRENLRKLAD